MKSLSALIWIAFATATWGEGSVGRLLPSEWETYRDEKTGASVTLITTATGVDRNIYQTHPNWTPDGSVLVFNSDRTGHLEHWGCLMEDGRLVQLTETDEDQPSSFTNSRKENRIWGSIGTEVGSIDLVSLKGLSPEATTAPLAFEAAGTVPEDFSLAGLPTLTADEALLCFVARTKAERNRIVAFDLKTEEWTTILETPIHIGHLQANPKRPEWLMYCHETGGDSAQRTWLIRTDGTRRQPFYVETPEEWVTHEIWWGGNRSLFTIWPKSISVIDLDTRESRVLSEDNYWHVGADPNGEWIVGDKFDGDLFLIEAETGKRKLLTAGHITKGAANHPHPSFSPDGNRAVFCTSVRKNWDIAVVEVNTATGELE